MARQSIYCRVEITAGVLLVSSLLFGLPAVAEAQDRVLVSTIQLKFSVLAVWVR